MALFNHLFPYSNFHDINLDWIISIIKSIDPATIQALQNLTPDVIEQVNQKVSEAQAFAIAAQSSASDANTAKDNAAASAAESTKEAALANADAVRAENAKIAVENSLLPVELSVTSDHANLSTAIVRKSGRFASIIIEGVIQSLPNNDITTLAKINGSFQWTPTICIKSVNSAINAQYLANIETDGRVTINTSLFAVGNTFTITGTVTTST